MNIEDKIIYKVPYIDTLQIWLQTPLESEEFKKLESLCGGESMYPYNKSMKFQKIWKYRIILQVPSDKAFDYLIKICRENILINKIHLALDLTTKDISDAEDINKKYAVLKILHIPQQEVPEEILRSMQIRDQKLQGHLVAILK